MDPAHLLGIGGAIGAVMRYVVGQWLDHERFPFATLLVNVLGSFVLGFITTLEVSTDVLLFVGVGACGAFTTYSSFSVDTVRLWEAGDRLRAISYATGTLVLCLLAVAVAVGLGSSL